MELATSSFGQGVTTSMIQMAAGFCSVINGGNYYVPHVVKRLLDDDGNVVQDIEPVLVRKTISKGVSDYLRTYLQAVVEEGTGYAAGVEGYTIGGKTGTAEKLPRGNGNYVLSFIGFTPVEDPQIMLYVVVDEPNVEDQEGSGAGAKLFSQVMEDLLPYLNVYATNSDDVSYDGTDEAVSADDETVTEGDTEADISSDDERMIHTLTIHRMEIHLTRMTVMLTIHQVMAHIRMIHRKVTPTQMIHRITARMTRIQMIAIQMIPRHMMKIPVVWRIIQMENDLIKYILNSPWI